MAAYDRMLAATSGDTKAETRDHAIVVTFFCLRLRVSELCGLNLEDCDLARGTTWIKGKARRERELVPLPALVVETIRRYLPRRGATWSGDFTKDRSDVTRARGPLFQSCGNRGKHRDGRLETRSVLRIVRELGQEGWLEGLVSRPCGTRASQRAIEKGQQAGVGLDQIRHFSRHKTLATMLIYRDEHDKAATQRTLADVVASTLLPD